MAALAILSSNELYEMKVGASSNDVRDETVELLLDRDPCRFVVGDSSGSSLVSIALVDLIDLRRLMAACFDEEEERKGLSASGSSTIWSILSNVESKLLALKGE